MKPTWAWSMSGLTTSPTTSNFLRKDTTHLHQRTSRTPHASLESTVQSFTELRKEDLKHFLATIKEETSRPDGLSHGRLKGVFSAHQFDDGVPHLRGEGLPQPRFHRFSKRYMKTYKNNTTGIQSASGAEHGRLGSDDRWDHATTSTRPSIVLLAKDRYATW